MSNTSFGTTPADLRIQSVRDPDRLISGSLNTPAAAASGGAADGTRGSRATNTCASLNSTGTWCLTGSDSADEPARVFPISTSVFHVGPKADMHLVLRCNSVSKHHADLIATPQALFIKDLSSTNGTFVNGKRLFTDAVLSEGDVIQFAEREFRVSRLHPKQNEDTRLTSSPDLGWPDEPVGVWAVWVVIIDLKVVAFFR